MISLVLAAVRALIPAGGFLRLTPLALLVLGVLGALVYGWLRLASAEAAASAAIAERDRAREALGALTAELEQTRAALERVERERQRSREAARQAEARQAAIRREADAMRRRLAAATSAHGRCEAALEELRRSWFQP